MAQPMTVSQLIEKLQQFNPNTLICVPDSLGIPQTPKLEMINHNCYRFYPIGSLYISQEIDTAYHTKI